MGGLGSTKKGKVMAAPIVGCGGIRTTKIFASQSSPTGDVGATASVIGVSAGAGSKHHAIACQTLVPICSPVKILAAIAALGDR